MSIGPHMFNDRLLDNEFNELKEREANVRAALNAALDEIKRLAPRALNDAEIAVALRLVDEHMVSTGLLSGEFALQDRLRAMVKP